MTDDPDPEDTITGLARDLLGDEGADVASWSDLWERVESRPPAAPPRVTVVTRARRAAFATLVAAGLTLGALSLACLRAAARAEP